MALLDEVRKACRIKTTELDSELTGYIQAAEADMIASGITVDENKELLKTAIINFTKAQLAESDESDRYMKVYDTILNKIALCDSYRGSG